MRAAPIRLPTSCYYRSFPALFPTCMRFSLLLGGPALAGLLLALTGPAAAVEIATGSMLGPRYKQDQFYSRTGPGSSWEFTYAGTRYRGRVRGSLALLRVSQALFDDEWLEEHSFDPGVNTDRVIEELATYKQFGIAGIVVGLQGADPGYSPQANGVRRGPSADLGKRSGALVSAYRADGSLKPAWLARLDRLVAAANRLGMIVCVVLFQQIRTRLCPRRRRSWRAPRTWRGTWSTAMLGM